jgi:hypothetical protein
VCTKNYTFVKEDHKQRVQCACSQAQSRYVEWREYLDATTYKKYLVRSILRKDAQSSQLRSPALQSKHSYMNGEHIIFDEFFLSLLFDSYLTGVEYNFVGLVCRQFHAKAQSVLYWRARITYGFPQGL